MSAQPTQCLPRKLSRGEFAGGAACSFWRFMIANCPYCKAVVQAVELETHYVHDEYAPTVRYKFGKCPSCDTAILTAADEEEHNRYGQERQLYPTLDVHVPENLPPTVRTAYIEAQTCFRASAYSASAIMCRKTMENVCVAHSVSERNLAKSLQQLRDAGHIDARLFEWAEMLRIAGNEAAHGAEPVSADDARDMLDFTAALVEYLFTFRDRFDAFKRRRERGKGGTRKSEARAWILERDEDDDLPF